MTDIDKLPPMCDQYSGDIAPLVLWPSGKVTRFPSLAKAKTMLMRHHQMYICMNSKEAWSFYNRYEGSVDMWNDYWGINETDAIADEDSLWKYLNDIADDRNPWVTIETAITNKLTKRTTAAGYNIDRKKAVSFQDSKNPKQAKVIASALLEFEDDGKPVSDADIEKLLYSWSIAGKLKTKQPVARIFRYYRKDLLQAEVLTLRK